MKLETPQPKLDYKAYGISSRQAKFCELLISDPKLPKYKAYLKIFTTKSIPSAQTGASNLLKDPKVAAYLSALEGLGAKVALSKFAITQERVLQEEACIAFHDIGALFDNDGFFIQNIKLLPEEVRRNISGLEISERTDPATGTMVPYYKVKFNDKGRSLERLEKHLGMLTEKVEIGIDVTLKGLIAQIDGKKTGKPMIPHLKG
ncbi:MAG: terminase small subunit [Planctomycetota bacterium]|jgi:hypothetical protein